MLNLLVTKLLLYVMIQQITDVPSNVSAFRAIGEVSEDDFKTVIIPIVNRLVEETDQLNYMLVLDTSVKNFTAGAWWQDALLGLKNITKWNRVAIVSDSDGINSFTDIFSVFIPGEFRGFYPEQLKVAIDWVSGMDIES